MLNPDVSAAADTAASTLAAPDASPVGASTAGAAPQFPQNPKKAARKRAKEPESPADKAVSRCIRAWNYAYRKKCAEIDEDEGDYEARRAANQAYLRATPSLRGYDSICDFIACIAFASVSEFVTHSDAECYLASAKVALSAICHEPKPVSAERRGRPHKTLTAGKNK